MAKADYSVSRGLQKVFIGALAAEFVVQVAFTVYNIVIQYPGNQNFSAYYGLVAQQFVMPLIFVTAAYLLNPRKIPKLAKLFESFVISLTGFSLMQLATLIAIWTMQAIAMPVNSFDYQWWMTGATVVLYIGALVVLRQRCLRKPVKKSGKK